jgi:hypothetical protein
MVAGLAVNQTTGIANPRAGISNQKSEVSEELMSDGGQAQPIRLLRQK